MQKEKTPGGQKQPSPGADQQEKKPIKNREDALDDALEETFPASDPVSIVPPKPEKPKP